MEDTISVDEFKKMCGSHLEKISELYVINEFFILADGESIPIRGGVSVYKLNYSIYYQIKNHNTARNVLHELLLELSQEQSDDEHNKEINIEEIDWMEKDDFTEGYWYFKYTGKLLTQEQIKELKLENGIRNIF